MAGTVAVVLVLAGAGFWVWHEQPSFCNAICHSPMDNYVESYTSGDAGMLVTQHAEAGKNCLDCHNPVITEQLTEVCTWVADDYPMTDDGMLNTGKEIATEEFCTNDGCHNMSDVVNATWGFEATTPNTTRIPAIRTTSSNAAIAINRMRPAPCTALNATT